MGIEDAFRHDILAHPDDDAPRLIYADWLEEQGDPRGEFIRVQCALARMDDDDPRRWPLGRREQELLREHEARWLPMSDMPGPWRFRRGFVEEITLTSEEFLASADRLFALAPIRHLRLRSAERSERNLSGADDLIGRIAESPHLARLSGLSLLLRLSPSDLIALATSPHLRQITELKLTGPDWDDNLPLNWLETSHLPSLRSLDLSGIPLSALGVGVLGASPRLTSLRRLNLASTSLTVPAVAELGRAPFLTNLTELNLGLNRLTHEVVPVLAEGGLLARLEALRLDANLLGDAGALGVRNWPELPRLRRLSLAHNQIFPAGVRAVAESRALAGLVSLDLFGNVATNLGAADLAHSTSAMRLRSLNLRFNGVADAGVRALARSPAMAELTWLNLTANRITAEGARALIASPHLARLARLDLPRNAIGPAEQEQLRRRFGEFVSF